MSKLAGEMRTTKRYRFVAAMALLMTLMAVNIVKALHFHDASECAHHTCAEAGEGSSCASSCSICDFVLPPFVEASPLEVSFESACVAPQDARICQLAWQAEVAVTSLRAPPHRAA